MKTYLYGTGILLFCTLLLNTTLFAQSAPFTLTNNTNCGWNITMVVQQGSTCGSGGICTTVVTGVTPYSSVVIKEVCSNAYWSRCYIYSAGHTYSVDCLNTSTTGPNCGVPTALTWTGPFSAEVNY